MTCQCASLLQPTPTEDEETQAALAEVPSDATLQASNSLLDFENIAANSSTTKVHNSSYRLSNEGDDAFKKVDWTLLKSNSRRTVNCQKNWVWRLKLFNQMISRYATASYLCCNLAIETIVIEGVSTTWEKTGNLKQRIIKRWKGVTKDFISNLCPISKRHSRYSSTTQFSKLTIKRKKLQKWFFSL